MTLYHNLLLCFITLLFPASIKQTTSNVSLISTANLSVKPGRLFLLGSDLTVYCHLPNCTQRSKLILDVSGTVIQGAQVKCTTTFHLSKVTKPKTDVRCKLKITERRFQIVGGLTLLGGLQPDKPQNIRCETTKASDVIDCSWDKGRETHVATSYNASLFHRGTMIVHRKMEHTSLVKLPREMFVNDTVYQLRISASNHFGSAHSELASLCLNTMCPVHLAVIPESPQINSVEFEKDSLAAMLAWTTPEGSQDLSLEVNLSRTVGIWEVKVPTRVREDLIKVNGLEPLTEYQFKMRTCASTSGERHCSKWSHPAAGTTPGRGPSEALQTWRIVGDLMTNGLRRVTVMWKALPEGEFSGEVKNYRINFRDAQKECPPALSQCEVLVPPQVSAMNVCVVTTYGTSPPARVPLIQSSVPGPDIRNLASSADSNSVNISWSYQTNQNSLNIVIQWTSIPFAVVWWKTAGVDQKTSIITGLTAGVRFNVSLYVVTTATVSAPSSRLFYSKELKPLLGPSLTVLLHERRKLLIRWADLAVRQQRGFLTHYTIYVQTDDPQNTEHVVTVSASGPTQKELDCPEGPLYIWMTASNSAGEGPRGGPVSSYPKPPAASDGLMMVLVVIIALFIAVIGNLLFWKCLRKRMKKRCMSWELSNSRAIQLLEQDKAEPLFWTSLDDPPLSPITSVQEESDVYPMIEPRQNQGNSEEQPLNPAAPGETHAEQQEQVIYKPQPLTQRAACNGTEADMMVSGDNCSRGLDINFLGFFDPGASLTSEFLSATPNVLQLPLRNIDVDSVIVESLPEENDFPVIHLLQNAVEAFQTGGYFPQVPTINMSDNSDTKE